MFNSEVNEAVLPSEQNGRGQIPLLPTVSPSVGPWYDNHEDCPRSFSCTQEKAYGNYNYNSCF